jgi:hypothetical protein
MEVLETSSLRTARCRQAPRIKELPNLQATPSEQLQSISEQSLAPCTNKRSNLNWEFGGAARI